MRGALSKTDLFARLAEGHAACITVVTPNKRLAQSLLRFERAQGVVVGGPLREVIAERLLGRLPGAVHQE